MKPQDLKPNWRVKALHDCDFSNAVELKYKKGDVFAIQVNFIVGGVVNCFTRNGSKQILLSEGFEADITLVEPIQGDEDV